MQYVRNTIGSVSKTWNSINPSTLSGAIDVIAVERPDGEINCSPFHIRFGKFSLLRPTQKGVEFSINGEPTNIPMKLGDGGEAFFVFETEEDVPEAMLTSPVQSPTQSAHSASSDSEPDYLDINQGSDQGSDEQPDEETIQQAKKEQQEAQQQQQEEWRSKPDPQEMDKLIDKLKQVNIPSTTNDRGEVIIDMTGYKPDGQDTKELEDVVDQILSHDMANAAKHHGDIGEAEREDRIHVLQPVSPDDTSQFHVSPPGSPGESGFAIAGHSFVSPPISPAPTRSPSASRKRHVKTLRLTGDMLKALNLRKGKNEMTFRVRESKKAIVTACIYLWDSRTPVVISDIDGTITKSDAMGHVMNMIGRDWTHEGVGKLFTDIFNNGYNIVYLTARAVGQAQTTRNYLASVEQQGYRLPEGPVILSPDRTVAALHREVIMRKPEIFKMACLRDLAKLYSKTSGTPFYAGFGNRITDALSYRSVDVPSTRIFTIDTNSEVRMELLELTGYRSSYVLITDLVDHFFPPIEPEFRPARTAETIDFTDANFWKAPLMPLSSDESENFASDEDAESAAFQSLDFRPRVMANFESSEDDPEGDSDYSSDDDERSSEDDSADSIFGM